MCLDPHGLLGSNEPDAVATAVVRILENGRLARRKALHVIRTILFRITVCNGGLKG